jgi:hypothetical protein
MPTFSVYQSILATKVLNIKIGWWIVLAQWVARHSVSEQAQTINLNMLIVASMIVMLGYVCQSH